MLSVLNNLFDESSSRVICRNLFDGGGVSISRLQSDVHQIRQKILSSHRSNSSRWLLSSENPYRFLVGLLTLLGMHKTVVISANQKSLWLDEISEHFDEILTDRSSDYSLIEKEKIDLSLAASIPSIPSNLKQLWKPVFTGNETLLFFTSGSTGKAKCIEKKLSFITDEVNTLTRCFSDISISASHISSVSHFHIYGLLFNLFWPLLSKRPWINYMIEFQEQLTKHFEIDNNLVFVSSPAFLSRLDMNSSKKLIPFIFSSGGPLRHLTAGEVSSILGNYPIEVYGSTETGGIAYRQQFSDKELWQLFDGVKLTQIKKGVKLTSPHIAKQSWVLLDDKINFFEKDKFLLVGRKDRIIKIEEKRVSLNEIEEFLFDSKFILDCAAMLIPGKRLVIGCALVLTNEGIAVLRDEGRNFLIAHVKQAMRSRFEPVTIPRKWRILERLPLNSQSKLDRSDLTRLFTSEKPKSITES